MGYLGDGRYDLLEMLKASKNPQINYEGLYEEPADTSINLDPMYNMGSRQFGDMRMGMPQATGIMQQAPQGIFNDYYGPNIDTSFGVANEEDEEQGSSFRDSLSGMGKKFGLSSLIGLITGHPILGLIGKGMGALKEGSSFVGPKGSTGYGNDSTMSLFRRSNTGAQFFQNLRDRRARNDAAARGAAKANMADARSITDRINTGPTERGPNENTGGGGSFGTSSNNNDSFSDYS